MTEVVDKPDVVAAPEAPATRLSDKPEVVSAVQAHLDAFAEDLEDTPVPAPATKTTEVSPEGEEAPVGETPAETSAPAEEKMPEVTTKEAAPAPAESTLPAAYRRTAKARGWTDEEIDGFAKNQPDLAIKTFERMHQSRTQEINEWADLGRKARQSAPQTIATSSPTVPTAPVAPVATALQPIDVKAMVEKFGNEELVTALAGPVNAAIAALAPIVQTMTTSQARARQNEMETLGKTIQEFFTHKDMAPYSQAYGTAISDLTADQITRREKVLETADALVSGARLQGRELSVQDALTLAHDSVAGDLKESAIREKIRTNVTKRERQITLKPTAQGRRDAGGPPQNRQELIGRTEDRLSAAFR